MKKNTMLFQVTIGFDVVCNVKAENKAAALAAVRLAGLSNKVQVTENFADVTAAGEYPFAPFNPRRNRGRIDPYDIIENYFGDNADFDDYAALLAKVANGAISPGELKQKFIKANNRASK